MKQYLIYSLILLFAALLFQSCQDEEYVTQISETALDGQSPLSRRLLQLTLNETRFDNVIDSTDCFRVALPVTLQILDETVLVDSEEDFATVDQLLQFDGSSIDFIFPITLFAQDYTEIEVNNQQQFDALISNCEFQDPIDCLDLIYPISLSAYNANSQQISQTTVQNNADFHRYISNLGSGLFYEINYPIQAQSSGTQLITLNKHEELNAALDLAIENCACDNPEILTDDLILYLTFAGQTLDLTGFSTVEVNAEIAYVTDRSGNPGAALSLTEPNAQDPLTLIGNPSNDLMQQQSFTISLWFNRQNEQLSEIPENLVSTNDLMLFLGSNDLERKPPFLSGPTLEQAQLAPFYDGEWLENLFVELDVWHHVAVTYQDGVLRLYRDGELRNQANVDGFNTMSGAAFGQDFQGFLDDIRFYKRALSADEIQILFELEGDTSQCLD